MKNITSLQGPVEVVDGKLMLRIPLAAGGSHLVEAARGIGEVDGESLNVTIPDWLAEKLGIQAGNQVSVSNRDGKLNIQPVNTRRNLPICCARNRSGAETSRWPPARRAITTSIAG
ncbi:MAG: hypothetical protein WB559_05240 [Candidatus Acidiferrales bacterium]